jgi:hypothetical protein
MLQLKFHGFRRGGRGIRDLGDRHGASEENDGRQADCRKPDEPSRDNCEP